MDPSNTLDEFIDRLQSEGVEAGLKEAEQIRAAADDEAAAVVQEAREESRQLVAQAEERARMILADAKRELSQVVRDVRLELRTSLERILTSLLEEGLERPLEDPELLSRILVEVVSAYARSDAAGETLEVDVRPELVEQLEAAAPAMLGRALADRARLDVRDGLRRAGFEYRIRDAVVEVSPESVAEKIAGMMSPQLRSRLRSTGDGPSGAKR